MIIINSQRFPGAGREVGRLTIEPTDRIACIVGPPTWIAEVINGGDLQQLPPVVPGSRRIYPKADPGPWSFVIGDRRYQLLDSDNMAA